MIARRTLAIVARRLVRRYQHRLSALLGVDANRRTDTVVTMLQNNARRAPGYWIQLVLATGIATLGLTLGSTAVVIGGMLVSPLMGPIIELGMGFAVGSSLLVIRAAIRVIVSVAVVIAGAALLTLALPFHDVTGEIAARAAPTALDLLIAIFCALTAAYTTVRPGADTTAAAAGTAIGIALVPPLCTTGFGLGIQSFHITSGAALLFTANVSSILLFSVLSFLLLGFDQVNAARLETSLHTSSADNDPPSEQLGDRVIRALRALFGSRYGLAVRVLLPLLFLAAVYVPLRDALDEVTWQVRTRAVIRRILTKDAPGAVQISMEVEQHAVALHLVVVDTTARGGNLEQRLVSRIEHVTGVVPNVTILTVPDARMLATVAANEVGRVSSPAPLTLAALPDSIGSQLAAAWPTATAGPLVHWNVTLATGKATMVTVKHIGASLGPAGQVLLAHILSRSVGMPVTVTEIVLPATPLIEQAHHTKAWLDSALAVLAEVAHLDSVVGCVNEATTQSGRSSRLWRDVHAQLLASPAAQAGRMILTHPAPQWTLRVAWRNCQESPGSQDTTLPIAVRQPSRQE
ncbi:MAG TPA: DUF389 domain-containing protein [Gemmatimonadaceae bacterium]|jgi:uncharacterized hydrophobic protein (TIGR00271 family)|nr:DUF389 domain-containing protein [Gemmatimonadaceae bacterium]